MADGEMVTIEWEIESHTEFKVTVPKAVWLEASSHDDGGEGFLADLETDETTKSYWVSERSATIDGEQVL